jgi:hypothetical protein
VIPSPDSRGGREAAPLELPAVDDVALFLRARTQDRDGVEVGTFVDDVTRPGATDVERHIAIAYALERSRIPDPCPEWIGPTAQAVVALAAACQIEKSYFPEQVRSGRSPYDELAAELTRAEAALDAAVRGDSAAGDDQSTHRYASMATPSFLSVYGDTWPADHWPEPENPANWRASPYQPPREPPRAEDLPVGDAPASGLGER